MIGKFSMEVSDFIKVRKHFEALIGLLVIFGLVLMLFNRISSVSAKIERATMDYDLSTIRARIQLFSFHHMIAGNEQVLLSYDATNPIELINVAPGNYITEPIVSPEHEIPKGSWYYNKESNELRYKIMNVGQFFDKKNSVTEARYQLKFSFQDNDNNRIYDRRIDEVKGLTLVPMGEYIWH